MGRNCFLKRRDCGAVGGGKDKKRKEKRSRTKKIR